MDLDLDPEDFPRSSDELFSCLKDLVVADNLQRDGRIDQRAVHTLSNLIYYPGFALKHSQRLRLFSEIMCLCMELSEAREPNNSSPELLMRDSLEAVFKNLGVDAGCMFDSVMNQLNKNS